MKLPLGAVVLWSWVLLWGDRRFFFFTFLRRVFSLSRVQIREIQIHLGEVLTESVSVQQQQLLRQRHQQVQHHSTLHGRQSAQLLGLVEGAEVVVDLLEADLGHGVRRLGWSPHRRLRVGAGD